MNNPDALEKLPQHPARMELLLAELIEQKLVDGNSLVVQPQSLFKRGYNQDIVQASRTTYSALVALIRQTYAQKSGKTEPIAPFRERKKADDPVTVVETNREGFYDALPEFLFHAPESGSGYKNIDVRIKESHQVRGEEAAARHFFLPFEQEFFRARVHLEQEERRLLSGFGNPMQQLIYRRFWGDVSEVDAAYLPQLFYLLPLACKIAGNQALMQACFETVLGEPVRLKRVAAGRTYMPPEQIPGLGEARLGVDLVSGAEVNDDLPDLAVFLGPVATDAIPDYLENGKKQRLLTLLYHYFVPAELEIHTHLLVKEEDRFFVLSPQEGSGRLGFSTFI